MEESTPKLYHIFGLHYIRTKPVYVHDAFQYGSGMKIYQSLILSYRVRGGQVCLSSPFSVCYGAQILATESGSLRESCEESEKR